MGFFARTWEHLKNGEQRAVGALKNFYQKEKPVVAAFVKKEAAAIKRGGEHLKTYVREHYPKVKAWMAKEKNAIVEAYHKGHITKRQHDQHLQRHEQHQAVVDRRHQELYASAHRESGFDGDAAEAYEAAVPTYQEPVPKPFYEEPITSSYQEQEDLQEYEPVSQQQQQYVQRRNLETARFEPQYVQRLGYGQTRVRAHQRRCNGGVTFVKCHERTCLMYGGKLYKRYNPRTGQRHSSPRSIFPPTWR